MIRGCLVCFRIRGDYLQSDLVWETHLQGKEEEECLNGIVASVHKIAQKEVIGLRALTTHLEELNQIVELAMNVTTNLGLRCYMYRHWRFDSNHIVFKLQDLFCFDAEDFHLGFLEDLSMLQLMQPIIDIAHHKNKKEKKSLNIMMSIMDYDFFDAFIEEEISLLLEDISLRYLIYLMVIEIVPLTYLKWRCYIIRSE